MDEPKTVSWKHIQYCKYNTNPHFVMLNGQMAKLTKARLIGQRREDPTNWYMITYDREYLLQYIIVRLLMPLGVTQKKQIIGLIDEAWETYLATTLATAESNKTAQGNQLFATNEIAYEAQ
jgi:hypothetical protein